MLHISINPLSHPGFSPREAQRQDLWKTMKDKKCRYDPSKSEVLVNPRAIHIQTCRAQGRRKMYPDQVNLRPIFLPSAYVVRPGPTSRKFILAVFHSVFCLSFCIQIPGFKLATNLVFGIGSGIPPSNVGAWLSNATLRFSSLAEQCLKS